MVVPFNPTVSFRYSYIPIFETKCSKKHAMIMMLKIGGLITKFKRLISPTGNRYLLGYCIILIVIISYLTVSPSSAIILFINTISGFLGDLKHFFFWIKVVSMKNYYPEIT